MRTKNNFYILLIIIFLSFIACSDDKTHTQNKVSQKYQATQNETITIRNSLPEAYKFNFEDLQKEGSLLHVKNDIYNFSNIQQPIIMVTILSTWCPPCRGEIPHLSNLQKKFKKHLFILSALVHDDISDEKLNKFIIAEKVHFFVSSNQKENLKFAHMIAPKLRLPQNFSLPLSILFVNGKYFTHYEGSIPEEMIESDIKQILEKIKGK